MVQLFILFFFVLGFFPSVELDFRFLKEYIDGLPHIRGVWFDANSIAWRTDKESFPVSLCGGLFEARWLAIQSRDITTNNSCNGSGKTDVPEDYRHQQEHSLLSNITPPTADINRPQQQRAAIS